MLIFYDVMFQIYGFQLFHSPYYYGYNKLYYKIKNTGVRACVFRACAYACMLQLVTPFSCGSPLGAYTQGGTFVPPCQII